MTRLLDGRLVCEECGQPLYSEGDSSSEDCYVHVDDLTSDRLYELLQDKAVLRQFVDWFKQEVTE